MPRAKDIREKVERFLKNNKNVLKISAIEKHLSLPKNSIQKFTKYDKRINDKRIKIIHKFLLNLSLSYDEYDNEE